MIPTTVDTLDYRSFDRAAQLGRAHLDEHGIFAVDLQPGDMTRYQIVVISGRIVRWSIAADGFVERVDSKARYLVKLLTCEPSEAGWTPDHGADGAAETVRAMGIRNPHTAGVLERFLGDLAAEIVR